MIKQTTWLLAALLGLSACSQQGFSSTAVLPDETMTEAEMAKEAAPMPADSLPLPTTPDITKVQAEAVLSNYDHLDPNHVVPTSLLSKAVVYLDANKDRFANKNYLVVVDFSKNSRNKRFFVVNLKSGAVQSFNVAHGKYSDSNNDGLATAFSNTSGSGQSSLGFYRTAETYSGAHGRSLRMDGLSSTNSKVRSRAIVVHGATYVHTTAVQQGRSLGCFALPTSQKDAVIDMIKGGALIYAGQS